MCNELRPNYSRVDQYQGWMQYLSVPNYGVMRQFDVRVPMRDDITLSTDLYLPEGEGPFPLILVRTPYNKHDPEGHHAEDGHYFAARGYAYAVQDVRGRYDSDGIFVPVRNEAQDGYDAVEWLAEQPWCNSKVGMYHGSYIGISQLLTAATRPPHLLCIVPKCAYADMYKEWVYSSGGALSYGLNAAWMVTGMSTRTNQDWHFDMQTGHPVGVIGAADSHYSTLPVIDTDKAAGRENIHWREWLSHPAYDDWWQEVSIENKYNEITVPALNIGGYYDLYAGGTPKNFSGIVEQGSTEQASKGSKMIMGPWEHDMGQDGIVTRVAEVDFGRDVLFPLREFELRWFDYWLKGIENYLNKEAPIKLFVMGENKWRNEYEWPLARTQYKALYLHSNGHANTILGDGTLSFEKPKTECADHYTYDPRFPVPTVGGRTCCPGMVNIPSGPRNNIIVEMRQDVLVYSSEYLTQDIEVTGSVKAVLYASSSARDTDWTMKLLDVSCDEYGQEVAINIADGILRARYRNGLDTSDLLIPQKVYGFEIDLLTTSNLFKKGHRIRVEISSSSFPQYDRNLNTGNILYSDAEMQNAFQTIFHDVEHPTHILLPIIPPA